mmetsp:Transcript_32541/g.74879  ORF Transcript_32541/g.74879 Transcript_32541/m.74879 type:complete len:321 (-) Transcript_32541:175-1137(-)
MLLVVSNKSVEGILLQQISRSRNMLVGSSMAKAAIPVIVACGRGRDISSPVISDAIISMAQRASGKATDDLTFLYLGTPDFESQEGLDLQSKAFSDAGCRIEHLKLTAPEDIPSTSEMSAKIEAADIVAVSGGNTLFAISRWRRLGVDRLLRTAWERGTIMCGGSAGGICWFDGGHSDSLDPATVLRAKEAPPGDEEKAAWEYVRVAGLGFVPALCCPHHDQVQSNNVPRSKDFDRMLLRNPAEIGICVDNNAAFVVEGDQYRALTTGVWEYAKEKGGGVQKKVYDNGVIISTPIECGGKLKSLSELLMPPDFTHLPSFL